MFACVWVGVHMEARGQFFPLHPSYILRQSLTEPGSSLIQLDGSFCLSGAGITSMHNTTLTFYVGIEN